MKQPSLLDIRLDEVVARLVIQSVEQSWLRAEVAALRELIVQSHADPSASQRQMDQLYETVVLREFEKLSRNVEAQLPTVADDVRRAVPRRQKKK